MTLAAIERARIFSQARLDELKARIAGRIPEKAAVIVCGSYARREASAVSDFDYFTILPAEAETVPTDWQPDLKRIVAETIGVEPARDGAFATMDYADRMVRNIGGRHDDNQKLTRRMLFLLEGATLSAENEAKAVRRALLDRYMGSGLDDGLARFLLDDIIRYYRTIAVDYEFKTREGDRPKPWGLRNIKLMFSRRLLYASGLFSVAEARDRNPGGVVARLEDLLDLPPINRFERICGAEASAPLLGLYDRFLDRLTDPHLRQRLESLSPLGSEDAEFTALKAEGIRFAAELIRLLRQTFGPEHPVHGAVLL